MKTTSLLLLLAACNPSPSGDDGGCPSPGSPTPGPADMHCAGQPVQMTNLASCYLDAGPDSGPGDAGATCPYGPTMFGQQADDDDCKYHVSWSSTPICEDAVTFTVTVTRLTDSSPVTMIPSGGVIVEPFVSNQLDASCDEHATHFSPSIGSHLTETPPGSGVYVGPVVFDAPGTWTVRFHIDENCADLTPDSPHGHAAFHVTVP